MMPTADVKETSYAAPIEVTRKNGRMLEAVESGQIVIDPEGRLLLGDDPGKPSMRDMCLLRAGIFGAVLIPLTGDRCDPVSFVEQYTQNHICGADDL
jgi:hypothetical protein